jgi:FMN phosphatase YigB (HAD superfamily)
MLVTACRPDTLLQGTRNKVMGGMPKPVLFLDDGGVLNDNAVRGPQWQRLVGEYFAPRLGGDPAAWAEANRVVMDDLAARGGWDALMRASADQADYDRRYFEMWLPGMCAWVGVPAPGEAECVALGLAAEDYIIPRVRSAIPGAAEAVRALWNAGYALHMGSGGASRLLQMYLDSMDIRECFGRLYGPDLIDAFKIGPEYYARILAAEKLAPGDALFLDDSLKALGWAAETGAGTLLVGQAAANGFERIRSLAELPGWLVERN